MSRASSGGLLDQSRLGEHLEVVAGVADGLTGDATAVAAAEEAEALQVRRQIDRLQQWMANAGTDPEWDDAAFATQVWLRVSPSELREVAEELMDLLRRWADRTPPEDGTDRESVLVFARGFPSHP